MIRDITELSGAPTARAITTTKTRERRQEMIRAFKAITTPALSSSVPSLSTAADPPAEFAHVVDSWELSNNHTNTDIENGVSTGVEFSSTLGS